MFFPSTSAAGSPRFSRKEACSRLDSHRGRGGVYYKGSTGGVVGGELGITHTFKQVAGATATEDTPLLLLIIARDMEMPASTTFFFFCNILLLLAFYRFPGAKAQDFSYKDGSENGPQRWGALRPEWERCNNGKMQSPVDLTEERPVPALGRLERSYKPAHANLKNEGHVIKLEWEEDAGSIHVGGTEYHLRQCHWHSPSEHTINGRRADLELHLVHQSADNKVAVVAVLYEYGTPDPFLAQLEEPLKRIAYGGEKNVEVGSMSPLNLELLKPYYRYDGSLTTPPCTEGVVWTVFQEVLTTSHEQVQMLKDAVEEEMKNNSRPIQPRNGRPVLLYPHWASPKEEHAYGRS